MRLFYVRPLQRNPKTRLVQSINYQFKIVIAYLNIFWKIKIKVTSKTGNINKYVKNCHNVGSSVFQLLRL